MYLLPVTDWVCNGTLYRLWLERDVGEFYVMVYEFFVSCQITCYWNVWWLALPAWGNSENLRLCELQLSGIAVPQGQAAHPWGAWEGVSCTTILDLNHLLCLNCRVLGSSSQQRPSHKSQTQHLCVLFLSTLTLAHHRTWSTMAALAQVFLLQHWCRGLCVTPSLGLEIGNADGCERLQCLALCNWRCVARAVWHWCCTGRWEGLPV